MSNINVNIISAGVISVQINGGEAVEKTVKPIITSVGGGDLRFVCDGIDEVIQSTESLTVNGQELANRFIIKKTFADAVYFKILMDETFSSGGPGGSSLFPTTGAGTATGAVIGDLDGNTLSVQQGGVDLLLIDPTAGSETGLIRAFNLTGDDNQSRGLFQTSDTEATFQILADFNDGVKSASIAGFADASASSITHTADSHIFNGVQEFADNAAAITGGLATGAIYRTGDLLKIVH